MPPKHEQRKPKVLELHFKPEGYVSTGDADYLDQFMAMIIANGMDPDQLIYRGFDAARIVAGEALQRDEFVYGMNRVGWENETKGRGFTAAYYAETADVPCVVLYDRSQLAEVDSATHSNSQDEDMGIDRIELKDIKKGRDLVGLPVDLAVYEEVVHKNFPDESTTKALVGFVYLEDQ